MTHHIPRTAPYRRQLITASAALLLALSVSACGGGSDGPEAAATSGPDSAQTLPSQPGNSGPTSESPAGENEARSLTATEADFSITLDQDSLAAGTYDIEVVNEGDATHDLVIERDGSDIADSEGVAPGESATLSVALEPGRYVFYCSIGNHRSMGMELPVEVT